MESRVIYVDCEEGFYKPCTCLAYWQQLLGYGSCICFHYTTGQNKRWTASRAAWIAACVQNE